MCWTGMRQKRLSPAFLTFAAHKFSFPHGTERVHSCGNVLQHSSGVLEELGGVCSQAFSSYPPFSIVIPHPGHMGAALHYQRTPSLGQVRFKLNRRRAPCAFVAQDSAILRKTKTDS